jgi:MinD-like ATPase involved in chromosome partitioning or flagellar assembly
LQTIVLTIVGPERRVDLVTPADVPLRDLMPTLLEQVLVATDGTPEGGWTLAPLAGDGLSLEYTLAESGVLDGQVLRLRPVAEQVEAPQRVMVPASPQQSGSPLARRLETLPRQPTVLERARGGGRYLERLDEAIRGGELQRCATIAVVSPKGGTGKSTVSILLAALLSRLRVDPTIVLDTDADYGSVGPWLAPDHPVSVYEVGIDLQREDFLPEHLEEQLAVGPDGLRICPAPGDAGLMAALDRDHYARVIARLQDVARILVLDCGAGLGQPGTQAAILASDQVVMVSDVEPATLDQVAAAARLLRHAGPPTVVAVNRGRLDDDETRRADELFPYASALMSISRDVATARSLSAGQFAWETAPRSWQRELRELAAVLVSAWPQLRLTATAEPLAL